jgi:hypothetical protein
MGADHDDLVKVKGVGDATATRIREGALDYVQSRLDPNAIDANVLQQRAEKMEAQRQRAQEQEKVEEPSEELKEAGGDRIAAREKQRKDKK